MALRLVLLIGLMSLWSSAGISSPGFMPTAVPEPEDNSNISLKKATLRFDSDRNLSYFGKSTSEIPGTQQRYRGPNVETGLAVEYSLSKQPQKVLLYDPGCCMKTPIYTAGGIVGGGSAGLLAGAVVGALSDVLTTDTEKPGALVAALGLVGGSVLGGFIGYDQASRSKSAESILGNKDRRIKVSNSKDWPWRVQGHLELNFGEKSTYIGSGTLIGPKHVLTAAHNLYFHGSGSSRSTSVVSTSFYPGLSGVDVPWSAQGVTMVVHPRYKNARTYAEQQESDIGMIILDRPLGNNLGYFGTREFEEADSIVHITGYPGDKGGREMYTMSGPIKEKTSSRVFYDIDTYGGQSGSGIYTWSEENKAGTCIGVHAYGVGKNDKFNSGTRLNGNTSSLVQNWIATHQ